MSEFDDDYGWSGYDDGGVITGEPWIDNGDGSFTDPGTFEIWQDGEIIGFDNGDGTWTANDGTIFDSDNNPIDGPIDVVFSEPDLPGSDNSTGGGFFAGLGNFLSSLFGGGGGGNSAGGSAGGGGGGFSGGQLGQAQQQVNRAQQQLDQAQQNGSSAQVIARLQQQLGLAQQMLLAVQTGDRQKLILIAALAGLGVYAWQSSRRR